MLKKPRAILAAGRPAEGVAPYRPGDGEAHLLARIAAGELKAFEALYRLYQPRLTRFLTGMLRRPQLIEEVLDDTLLVVWNRPQGYNGASKVSTWIFAIAYRKALKALRRGDEPVEDPDADQRPSPDDGPDAALTRLQVRQALLDAMAALSFELRMVVDLCYFQDMGYREIADIMDCPVDTVKTRMFHARRRLKASLAAPLSDWL